MTGDGNKSSIVPAAARMAPANRSCVVRIEMTPTHRRQLGAMAIDVKVSADEMASRLLASLLDDDAAMHETNAAAAEPGKNARIAESGSDETAQQVARIDPAKRESVEHNGVLVDFRCSAVIYRGRKVDVSTRGAEVVAALARIMPEWMTRDEIAARAFPDLSQSSGYSKVSGVSRGLMRRLPHIGLTITREYGLGLALQVKEDPA